MAPHQTLLSSAARKGSSIQCFKVINSAIALLIRSTNVRGVLEHKEQSDVGIIDISLFSRAWQSMYGDRASVQYIEPSKIAYSKHWINDTVVGGTAVKSWSRWGGPWRRWGQSWPWRRERKSQDWWLIAFINSNLSGTYLFPCNIFFSQALLYLSKSWWFHFPYSKDVISDF